MKPMNSLEIRQKFLTFFEKRQHAILPSAPLVTTDEKGVTNSTLFNTAGMQSLVPFLMGELHPKGSRLANSQKCIRTTDIDEVGDSTHATFFEMLGNWSLGDYFKEEAIKWSFEFLTDQEEGLGLDPSRLYITVFEGDNNAPKDEEAYQIWQQYVPANRIYFMGAKSNWWSAGDNGPCGPDTEMFYDVTETGLGDLNHQEFLQADEDQHVVEIWNDVFMQYEKKDGQVIGKLANQNVDTGSGLERIAMVVQGVDNIFATDLFVPLLDFIKKESQTYNEASARIVADHLKAGVFIIKEGVRPSNTDRGYIVRRLLRRAIRHSDILGLPEKSLEKLSLIVKNIYEGVYFSTETEIEEIIKIITEEEDKFRKTLTKGLKEFKKGTDPFILFTTYGFPIELTKELAKEEGREIDEKDFAQAMEKHQATSRQGAEKKFAGGLADHSEKTVKYHTATHLLHQALIDVLGAEAKQKGSNITEDRLRFDFTYSDKLTPEQKEEVTNLVNEKIKENLPVNQIILPKSEAEKTGARHLFNEKYGDDISIYYIGDSLDSAYSKEYCGGPHVDRTGELGTFKIIKEESVAAGVRRIKAILE